MRRGSVEEGMRDRNGLRLWKLGRKLRGPGRAELAGGKSSHGVE
jgi:hypothetical protein